VLVNVRFFAQLRDTVGAGELPVTVADSATVKDVWQAVAAAHPSLTPFEKSISCAVNAAYARMHTRVNAGDDVAFLPPVSGG
jgi:molybdopterin converting factor subunit 1